MKNFSFLFSFFLSTLSFSQLTPFPEAPTDKIIVRSVSSSVSRSLINMGKLNFTDLYQNNYSTTPDYDYYFLFPDTMVYADYGTTFFNRPFTRSVGMTYDLSSPIIQSSFQFDTSSSSTIDSISVNGTYKKGRANYTDTLIYRIITPTSGINLNQEQFFSGQLAKYPTSNDTTRCLPIKCDATTDVPFGVISEIKVPLNEADTNSQGIYNKMIPVNVSVPKIFAVTVSYKSGGTYSLNSDTLGKRLGQFVVATSELNGDGTYRNYIPGDYTGGSSRTTKSAGVSSFWDTLYIPYLAYLAGQFDVVEFDLVMSQNNVFCDSTIENKTISCSSNSFYTWRGRKYYSSGSYCFLDTTGCDTLRKLNLTFTHVTVNSDTLKDTVCGYSYTLPSGRTVNKTGIHIDTLTNNMGCDSLRAFDLIFIPEINRSYSSNDTIYSSISNSLVLSRKWLYCDSSFRQVPSMTQSSMMALSTGNYAVEITSISGCVDTSNCSLVILGGAPAQCEAKFELSQTSAYVIYVQDSSWSTVSNAKVEKIWHYGDGFSDTGISFPTHTYATTGKYLLCLELNTYDSISGIRNCYSMFCDTLKIDSAGIMRSTVSLQVIPYGSLGIKDEVVESSVSIFPNPALNMFTIVSDSKPINRLSIYSLDGSLIQDYTIVNKAYSLKTGIGHIEKGVYILKIKVGDSMISKRLIKL